MDTSKDRLDNLVFSLGLSESRERAKSQIMAGNVYVNGVKIDKPGTKVDIESKVEVKGSSIPYVSRGGLKLERAIKCFNIDINGKVTMDIGASTGGFTDCMLQNGAAKVYSIDVGYGQLAWKLRIDSRVICMERTNIRYVNPEMLEDLPQFASIDVSFISLTKVLPTVINLLDNHGSIVCLIKPQFEAGRERVGKKGVVRDKSVHEDVISTIVSFCTCDMNLHLLGLTYSPIKGPEGNIEYLMFIGKNIVQQHNHECNDLSQIIKDVVEDAHNNL